LFLKFCKNLGFSLSERWEWGTCPFINGPENVLKYCVTFPALPTFVLKKKLKYGPCIILGINVFFSFKKFSLFKIVYLNYSKPIPSLFNAILLLWFWLCIGVLLWGRGGGGGITGFSSRLKFLLHQNFAEAKSCSALAGLGRLR
jgi:hypothetical protein